jgi:hypothetical protein
LAIWPRCGQLLKAGERENQAIGEYAEAVKGAGGDVDGEYQKEAATSGNLLWASPPDPLTVINNVVGRMKTQADAAGVDMPFEPLSEQDITDRAVTLSQAAMATQERNLQRPQTLASRLGSFVGMGASGLVDPINIPAMALPFGEMGVLATAGLMGAANAGAQTASEIANQAYNERVTPGYAASGQGVENVVGAGVGGAVLGGGLKVLGNVLTRTMTGQWPTAAKDAANGVMSEADILNSNVLPGAEGEAAHQGALGQSIGQILRGDPVDVSSSIPTESDFAKRIGDLSGDYGTTATIGQPYARDTMRLNDEPQAETLMAFLKRNGGVQDSGGSLKAMDMIKGYPGLINKSGMPLDTARELAAEAGYLGPDTEAAVHGTDIQDLLDRLGEGRVYSTHDMGEVGRAGDAAKFNEWMGRRDDAVAEIQNHVADEGGDPLDAEHADAAAEHRMNGAPVGDAIERGAADLYVRDAAQARSFREAPEMPEIGYEPPTERPQGYAGEPGAGDYYAGLGGRERPGAESNLGAAQEALRGSGQAAEESRPGSLTGDQIREQLAAPEAMNAARADVERAIDEAAQSKYSDNGTLLEKGKALQTPTGLNWTGGYDKLQQPIMEPVFRDVADQLAEVDKMNDLAAQILECATPGAMQMAAE